MSTEIDRQAAYTALRGLFEKLKSQMPVGVAERLRCGRSFVVHKTRRTQLVFEIYDAYQTAALPKSYFKYCVVYDPERLNHPQYTAFFHLWLTTVRIYRGQSCIKSFLEREIPRVVPKGFKLEFVQERAISCGKMFNWPTKPERLECLLLSDLAKLVRAIHPTVMRAVDNHYESHFSSSDRRKEVAKRGRIFSGSAPVVSRTKLRKYSRSIPPSWKTKLLEAAAYKCQQCGADVRLTGHHFDHKIPFSREGGDTVFENLQVLCVACNLRKGNRL